MKKLLFILLIPFSSFSQSTLIFSEYGEGTSNNKWVEIYNPTFQQINLDEYRYNFCWNDCDSMQWEFSIPFDSGYVLMPGQTYLIVHHNADTVLLSSANQTTNILSNGNDVCALYNITMNQVIDVIGDVNYPVSDGWDILSDIEVTKNHTLIRNPNVCGGNLGDWSSSDGSVNGISEWSIHSIDDFNNLNTHTSDCISSTSVKELDTLKREIVEVRDELGRKTKLKKNVLLFYIREDGTVDKQIIIE